MNRLAHEKSLYLRQHADNPVDWYPWGPEAWARAQAEDKPVLVSVGYSACHWCHVMAHECFENPFIAKLMNENFVCIKVDREERPDVDQIYMEAVQMVMGHGGWPLNAFCLPDGRPFAGGTYFPPTDNGRGIPWPQLLMRVADYFRRQRADLEDNAASIVHNLGLANQPGDPTAGPTPPAKLVAAARTIAERHDDTWGGFGGAPKFPPAQALGFLLAIRHSRAIDESDPTLARRLDFVVTTTLDRMAQGGIFDQLGGGFCRYSVDGQWLIPHFEKMLYDNGLLLGAYAAGYARYRRPLYRAVLTETVAWLEREMLHPAGGFCAALDADSEGHEGKYYVWTLQQLRAALGGDEERVVRFAEAYHIIEEGNFEDGASNPALLAGNLEEREALAEVRARLLAVRQQRVPPGRDPKVLTAWNALAVRGLTEAAWVCQEPRWHALATGVADFLWQHLRQPGSDRLHTVWYAGEARGNAFLDDYAYLAEAELALAATAAWANPGATAVHLERAQRLVEVIYAEFTDASGAPGLFFTSSDHETLVTRKKEWWDNALPSGQSSLLHSLAVLDAVTGDRRYAERLRAASASFHSLAEKAAAGVPYALAGLTKAALGVAVLKGKGHSPAQWRSACAALAKTPPRPLFLLDATADAAQPEGWQLCVGTQCLPPTSDIGQVAAWL